MRVTRKEIKKPNSERVRYSLTELTPAQFNIILKALGDKARDGALFPAAQVQEVKELLSTLESVQEGEQCL